MENDDKLREYLKKVTTDLRRARRRIREVEDAGREPLAIVGMSCRYPGGASSPEELWRLVESGGDAIAGFPDNRGWDVAGLHDADPGASGTSYVREGGFVYDAGDFDPDFFGISPREALAMDPQQRLLLQTSWEAFERAGIPPATLRGSRAGVFVGAAYQGYGTGAGDALKAVEGHLMTGNATSVISGRLSYTFGLQGPAVTVDTACSSSLVALHLAGQSLRQGESDLALVGGVAVMIKPDMFVEFSRQRGLAADGRCKAFAEAADGTGWGEGAGMLVLERLSDARRNGHPVLAVVRGSAVNQDGASSGLSAPNGLAQQRVIRAALENAGLTTSDIDTVEAHGTGTELGDPIEAGALLATYGTRREAEEPLWLGSLKSNIGHTQAAAGVGGVIKMVMALRHGVLPRTLHVDEPSSHVDWSAGAVELLTEPRPWPATGDRPRRAAVSSFGISGTNAHTILEQAPEPETVAADDAPAERTPALSSPAVVPWVVSGRSEAALRAQAARLAGPLADASPVDAGFSLAATRSVFEHRAVVVGTERAALLRALSAVAEGAPDAAAVSGAAVPEPGRVAYVFPGQGSQWAGMAVDLLAESPVFAERLAACDTALSAFVDWSVRDVLHEADGAPPLERVDVVQPVLWAVMVSLAEMWRGLGVAPGAVLGHSQGEIAAAVVSGALSLEDGARVAALRSRAINALAGLGGMVSVAAPLAAAEELVARWDGRVGVAAVNGPTSVVVAGESAALDELVAHCEATGARARRIAVDYASHSAAVEAVRDELLDVLGPLTPREPAVPFFSTVTGAWVTGAELDAEYWYTNLRQTVFLDPAVRALAAEGFGTFVEVSAHPVLTVPVAETLEDAGRDTALVVGTLRRGEGGTARVLLSAGEVFAHGTDVDWTGYFPAGARRVDLPTYAYQQRQFWLAADAATAPPTAPDTDDARFWEVVDSADLQTLARTLDVGTDATLGDLLPALTQWRRRRRENGTLDSWRYRVTWKPVTAPDPRRLGGTWTLVVPEGLTGHPTVTAVDDALTAHGARTALLEVTGADEHRDALTGRLRALDDAPTAVVSLLALAEQPHSRHPELPHGTTVTLLLAQALRDAAIDAPLWLLTQGGAAATAQDAPPRPEQAQIWGLGRVVGLEDPARWGGLVDLPPVLDARTADRLAAVLAAPGGEDQLALRPAGVLAARLTRAPRPTGRDTPWTCRGTVLVTGGTGALGPRIARALSAAGAEHVVLVSRRGPAAPGADLMTADLADLTADVTLAACDVADRDDLTALVARLEDDGHDIRGVVHAAALIELAAVDRTDPAAFAAVARAKVTGAQHLDALFDGGRDLDFLVLFSSIAGVWGSGDHAAYAAANAHLDALAARRRARGRAATSVAWGVWNAVNPWDDSKQNQDVDAERLIRQGLPFLDPDTALAGLTQILADDETFIALADVDWERFAPVFCAHRDRPLLDGVPEVRRALAADALAADGPAPAGESSSGLRARLAALSPADRLRDLLDVVRTHAAAVLGHDGPDAVDPRRALRELGFDSLTAVELRNRLNKATGLRLPATLVFDHPSATAVAERIRDDVLGTAAAPQRPATVVAVAADEPVAIVAMGCRYPGGVDSPDDLWRLVESGGDAIGGFPADRGWDLDALYDPDPDHAGTTYADSGGFLHDGARFDPGFFGISPREALTMDPQQRMLLETSWETMERAGIDPHSLRGTSTGVFVGTNYQDYGIGAPQPDSAEGHLLTGGAASVVSGRLSYTFGLEGPAITLDTACSSSLVALHLATQALRQGECDLALAGGVAMMSTPGSFIAFSRQRALAADGRCKAFADDADGMGLAEGVSMVMVERLSDARRNGHPVLAVIRGSAVNQDGASNGLTAPNGPSQQRVIQQALANARLTTGDIDAVEAHGTGTRLGDPIEAQALLATYGQDRTEPLWLGSVKSNIGHTQAASGVAGVIKMVLALGHETLPRTLHADHPSSHVDWTAGAVELLTEARPWPRTDTPRRAAVSSFGMSGTNVHTILEEPPAPAAEAPGAAAEPAADIPRVTAWPLTGRTDDAVRAQAARLVGRAAAPDPAAGAGGEQGVRPVDVGYSLAAGRATFDHRAVVIARDRDEFDSRLTALAQGSAGPGVVRGTARRHGKVAFVFPGQGSQWVGMALELLDSSPAFAARMAECADALRPHVDWSLLDVLRDEPGTPPMDRVDVVQPVLWAVMVSLARLWRDHGVEPDGVIGHSQGEIAAAAVAGALSLEDAALVVALRSKAIGALAGGGGMVSVAAPLADVEPLIAPWGERISVAAVNGPAAVVVSGTPDALDELLAACESREVRARRVPVDYASHSAQVETLREELLDVLAPLTPRACDLAFHSTVTGEPLDTTGLDADYWYTNLRRTVLFEQTTRAMAAQGYDAFIECSPHPVIAMSVQDVLDETGTDGVVVGSLRRGEGGPERFLTSLAEAYTGGVPVDWTTTYEDASPRRVDLPTYPFQRQRYWLDAPVPAAPGTTGGDTDDAPFWDAVDNADLERLTATLDVDGDTPLRSVLPALSTWRRRQRDEATVDSWSYRVGWKGLPDPVVPLLTGRWIALAPTGAADGAAPVLEALAERGADLVRLDVPADTAADRAVLAERLREAAEDGPVDGVLSLLALTGHAHPGHPVVPWGAAATHALALALADTELTAPLWLLTRGAVSTGQDDAPADPVGAQTWGLGRVVGLEYPRTWGGLVDLPAVLDHRAADRLAGVLAGADGEDQLAIRSTGTLVRRLLPARTPGSAATPPEPWTPRGTVLVTGGTGAVGAHVARWLAREGAAHLVLTSRRGAEAPGAPELRAELTALGCEVTLAACDMADRAGVAELLGKLRVDGRAPSAVFHAAGLPQATALADSTPREYAEVAAAKVGGATHLDALLGEDLDAFVLFSSNSGVWGSAGQGAYAAANAHLDALAEQRRARGLRATSVAWGLWDGGGMAEGEGEARLRRRGLGAMRPDLAVAALHGAVSRDETFLAVADVDWDTFADTFAAARRRPLLDDLPQIRRARAAAEATEADAGARSAFADRVAALSGTERAKAVRDLVRAEAATVLGYADPEAVGANRPFRELGFDSVTAVEVSRRLRDATGLRLAATVVFDYPTVTALARHLTDRLVPAGNGALSVIDELDRLEEAMGASTPDESVRMRVQMRLKALLGTWDEAAPDPDPSTTVAAQLESASAAEVLSFIDSELGLN